MCILMYKPLQTSGRWAHFLLRESDRNLSTWLIIPQLQQFIVCFSQGHLYQQPNKSALPAFVPKRPHALSVTQAIQDVFQLICNHLGLASHKPGIYIYIIFHWLETLSQPPCSRRAAFPFPFQLTSFSFFFPLEIRNLQWGEKKKFLWFQGGAFLSDKLPLFFYHCLKLSEAIKSMANSSERMWNLCIQNGTSLKRCWVPGSGFSVPRSCL